MPGPRLVVGVGADGEEMSMRLVTIPLSQALRNTGGGEIG